MFKILGIMLVIYCLHAIGKGEVFAKSGSRGRTVSRVESPRYFLMVIAIYLLLGFALIAIF